MMQPKVFVDPKGANKVCKLQQSIYGTGASISELEYMRWSLYLQVSEWEHYSFSDKYMWMTYFWSEMM